MKLYNGFSLKKPSRADLEAFVDVAINEVNLDPGVTYSIGEVLNLAAQQSFERGRRTKLREIKQVLELEN